MRSMLRKQSGEILVRRQFNKGGSQQSRRGVLLLIVVSMLTLFLMLGTAYIVTASRARESARALSRKTLFADQLNYRPETYLDAVLMRVVRGGGTVGAVPFSGDPAPTIESLLEDRYGGTTLAGTVSGAGIYSDAGVNNTGPVISVSFAPSASIASPALLNGRILTLTAPGKPTTSHRIVRALGSSSPYTLAVTNQRGPQQWTAANINQFVGSAIINGREFSGDPLADLNESWDGFDFAYNPFLAHVEPSTSRVAETNVVRPSYLAALPSTSNNFADNDGDGVNDGLFLNWGLPSLPTAEGSVDLHASVLVIDLDGRFNVNAHGSLSSMPLRDGSPTNGSRSIYGSGNPNWPNSLPGADWTNINTDLVMVPLGSGVGPAEINPDHLFSTLALNAAGTLDANNVPRSGDQPSLNEQPGGFFVIGGLASDARGDRPETSRFSNSAITPRVGAIEGRYGGAGANLSSIASDPPNDLFTTKTVAKPGSDVHARHVCDTYLTEHGFPTSTWFSGGRDAYNSPPDLLGRMKFVTRPALNESAGDRDGDGRATVGLVPRSTYAKAEWADERVANPYSTRLTSVGSRGGLIHSPQTTGGFNGLTFANPFTVAELESLLRPYDTDSTNLPVRLTAMLGTVAEQMRTRLTTESWDTTCVVDGAAGGAWGRLATSLATLPPGAELYNVSPVLGAIGGEISRGEKFNLNRPLTNTKPGSYLASDLYYLQRQAYFKDLYTLICLLANPVGSPAERDRLNSSHTDYDQAFQREVAQWAANVVEFRDTDSTMTPYEYDTNVFNGWDVDGDVTTFSGETERGEIVWGLERPEVVLTSAVGWEDASDGEIYVCIHRPWKEQALDASGLRVANKLDADLAVGGGDDLDLIAVNGGYPVWRFRIEEPGGSSTYIPITVPALSGADWTALGKSAWPAGGGDLELGGDGSLLIRLTQTLRNALLLNSLAGTGSYATTMPAAPEHLLRDDGGGVEDREFELFNVTFPGSVPAEGVDRELIVHLERLSCPAHTFVPTSGMQWTDAGDRIDNEDPDTNGGDQDTSYLSSPRYVEVDAIRLVVANRDIDADMDAIDTAPSHADIQSLENTRSITTGSGSFWRMNPLPLGTGRGGSGANAAAAPGSPNLDVINVIPGGQAVTSPWPNRPFHSAVELLLVPNDAPTQFLRNYDSRLLGSPATDLPSGLLLDAVTVPTWFAGVHDSWADGSNLLRGQTGIDERINPVNQLSSYREPGRVNLNTVTTNQVWDTVVAGPLYVEDVNRNNTLDPGEDVNGNGTLDQHPVTDRITVAGVRVGADLASTPVETMEDVFQIGGAAPVRFDTNSTYHNAVDVDLNPLHKLYTASRLANTATVRSNVFAIWVTLRESISGDPDSVKYHRAFYIVDRSIPVGFESGEDHNVRDVIRLRRIIE